MPNFDLKTMDLTKVLVHDIETVSSHGKYTDLSPAMQKLWNIKSEQIQRRTPEEDRLSPEDSYEEFGGIYAEFGKICCISVGAFVKDKETGQLKLHVKSYYDHDEHLLLTQFAELIEKRYNNPERDFICGHNIKEFDIPFICRRMIVNKIPLPNCINLPGKKPWETQNLLDTLTLWKFGDYKSYTSLKLLCGLFGIPTPKDDIDGSEVGKTYWKEDDLDRIEIYCKKDVVATAQVLVRMALRPLLTEDQIVIHGNQTSRKEDKTQEQEEKELKETQE
ncbi:MAG: ribonuclease H-like domain-containing protein [Saprospiraceae bacterium]|nr:ribonuclease H-like domain-containing protein [Saprospiraceae bacterium]